MAGSLPARDRVATSIDTLTTTKARSSAPAPLPFSECQDTCNVKDDEHFRKSYLLPALEAGLVEMTIPDKPRSSRQKYRITDKGRQVMARHGGG